MYTQDIYLRNSLFSYSEFAIVDVLLSNGILGALIHMGPKHLADIFMIFGHRDVLFRGITR